MEAAKKQNHVGTEKARKVAEFTGRKCLHITMNVKNNSEKTINN